jgi:hypothetical protein
MSVGRSQVDPIPRPVWHVRLSLRVALAVAVALGLAAGGRALWNVHQQAERDHAQAELQARYLSAEAALSKLMPADVTAKECEAGFCGASRLNPSQVAAQIKAALPGSKIAAVGDDLGCPGRGICTTLVEGGFDGFEAVGMVSWHMLLLPDSRTPPRGAIEWRPRPNRRPHRRETKQAKRLFFLCTDVDLYLREPSGLRSEE